MLRDVGAVTDARKVIEDAYQAETNEVARRKLAYSRALVSIDLDDNLAWLEKCEQEDFEVKTSLLLARSRKARQQGKDADAEKLCREALEMYKGKPEDGAMLNNSALVYFELYELTHDTEWFKGGTERMEKAVGKIQGSATLLRNLSSCLMSVLAADVVGDALAFKAMRQRPALGHLAYLYADEAGRKKLQEKLKAHPAMGRLRGHLARLRALAPRQPDAYSELALLHELLGEREEMKALRGQLAGADVDTADAVRSAKEYFEGKKDDKNKEEIGHSITRARDAVEACREKKGPTLAAALARLSSLLMQMNVYEPADADEVVKLAEEAHEVAPSDATAGALVSGLVFRAHGRLKKANPAFAALSKRTERSMGTYLLNWVIVRGGPMRAKILADPDFKRAADLKARQSEAVPAGRGSITWALLKGSHPKQAEAIAARIRGGLESDKAAIDLALAPLSGPSTVERAFALEIEGKAEAARELVREKAKAGVPLPGGG
jgi:hypothetical protein